MILLYFVLQAATGKEDVGIVPLIREGHYEIHNMPWYVQDQKKQAQIIEQEFNQQISRTFGFAISRPDVAASYINEMVDLFQHSFLKNVLKHTPVRDVEALMTYLQTFVGQQIQGINVPDDAKKEDIIKAFLVLTGSFYLADHIDHLTVSFDMYPLWADWQGRALQLLRKLDMDVLKNLQLSLCIADETRSYLKSIVTSQRRFSEGIRPEIRESFQLLLPKFQKIYNAFELISQFDDVVLSGKDAKSIVLLEEKAKSAIADCDHALQTIKHAPTSTTSH